MLAISKEIWLEAKFLFEVGKSLKEISDATGINKSTISKKSTSERWKKSKNQHLKSEIMDFEEKKSTLIQQKSTLTKKISQLDDYEIVMLSELVENESHIKSLLLSTTALNIIRVNENLKENTKLEKINVGDGVQNFEKVGLGSSDYKNHQDTLDKASITLGINERFALYKQTHTEDDIQEVKEIKITRIKNNA